jgi:hypothetical protein
MTNHKIYKMKTMTKIAMLVVMMSFLAFQVHSQNAASGGNAPKAPTTVNPQCKYVDNNKDGICDNCQGKIKDGKCANCVDKNGDGICDNNGKCKGAGAGNGKDCKTMGAKAGCNAGGAKCMHRCGNASTTAAPQSAPKK